MLPGRCAGHSLCIDFGASSLIALEHLGIAHNSIDVVLPTHLHGDHCGGIPFLLMDAMLAAKRDRPLTIAGPRENTERMKSVAAALMPGAWPPGWPTINDAGRLHLHI
jgi:ribonuclease BN (tRNA processing enzyme)